MYDKIIVPVNDPIETPAVSIGLDLARAMKGRLELASVVSHGVEQRDLGALAELARRLGPDVSARVITDDDEPIARQLARLAGETGALMCLDSKARRAIGEVLLGSVGEEVIRCSRHPLLAIGPQCRRRLAGSKVKVAVDGTVTAEAVVTAAARLAAALSATTELLLVTGPVVAAYERAYLEDLAAKVGEAGIPAAIELIDVDGVDVRQVLVEAFNTPETSIGAMATHGLGKMERLAGGSVVLDVLREVHCPIMVSSTGSRASQ